VIKRGEIWWAVLPTPSASEPGYKRPLLIIQSNDFNRSKIRTVIAVVITSNLRLAAAPGNVLLPRKSSGLPKESVANVSQLITADKSFLTEKAGNLPLDMLQEIDAGIQLVLSL
jgi:mRNA interferase MazF